MRTHSIQKVALAEDTKAFGLTGFCACVAFGSPRNGMFPIEFVTAAVESSIVIVPRMVWLAMAPRRMEFGSLMKPWNSDGYGPLLCEPTMSAATLTSGTMCSLPSPPGGGISVGWMPNPSEPAAGWNAGSSGIGKIGGMFGPPGFGVGLGAGPCISRDTPCGMLASRTILAGTCGPPGAASGFTMLAGTLMNSPGSM